MTFASWIPRSTSGRRHPDDEPRRATSHRRIRKSKLASSDRRRDSSSDLWTDAWRVIASGPIARLRRSARRLLGGARSTLRSGPGGAGPKTPQMASGPPAAQSLPILTGDQQETIRDFGALRTSGFWHFRLAAFRLFRRVAEITILL